MKRFGSRELLESVIRQNLCINCGACQELCPYFRSYRGKTAMLFPCTQTEGRCFAYCPKAEADLDALSTTFFGKPYSADALGSYKAIVMARAGDRIAGAPFQSGGTVSALMQCALDAGTIDAAILTAREGIAPVPFIAATEDEIRACASSKYTAAPTLAALHRAAQRGWHKIGIVSTPCQALAVAKMRYTAAPQLDLSKSIALVIGLFCTWSLDFRAFEAFLSERIGIGSIRKIDIPPPPAEVMEVFTNDGKQEFNLKEIRALVPETCSYCHDMTAEFADVSVGVVEGKPDWNTVIIRTDRGKQLVEEARDKGWLILEELPGHSIAHLQWAAGNKKRRGLSKGKINSLIGPPDGERFALLRLNPETLKTITESTTED